MRDIIEEAAKTTSGIWKINQGHIASFSIPLPGLEEQHRIVAYLDGMQSKLDALKRHQAQTAALPQAARLGWRGPFRASQKNWDENLYKEV
jgi:type I restriction enzyme S subunit